MPEIHLPVLIVMRVQYSYFGVVCIKLLYVAWQVKTVGNPALVYLHIVELAVAEDQIRDLAFPEGQLPGCLCDSDVS